MNQQSTDWSVAKTWYNGVNHTNALTGDGHTHAAASACAAYNTARPTGASIWFLPSIGQWNLMVKKLSAKAGKTEVDMVMYSSTNNDHKSEAFNSVITGAGGTGLQAGNYWSSSECNSDAAWYVYFYYGYVDYNYKNSDLYVRSAFAF